MKTAVAYSIETELAQRLIGQPQAIRAIAPYVEMHRSGLSPEGRPAGVFLLLGPSGSGKTKTVEALAEVLHGSERNVLRIDCAEFQMEHEVAKLIGAPPGYLGHRETQPVLTQQKVSAVTSDHSNLALVLFDEIEKAAPSLLRLLLGVLDKASLRLGDNTQVSFEKSLIFLTSNIGAAEISKRLTNAWGIGPPGTTDASDMAKVTRSALRRSFAPEFLNRIDVKIAYEPLSPAALDRILTLELARLQSHISRRLGARQFSVEMSGPARDWVLAESESAEYGAREMKRVLHQAVLHPIAQLVVAGQYSPGGRMVVSRSRNGLRITASPPPERPTRVRSRGRKPTAAPAAASGKHSLLLPNIVGSIEPEDASSE